MQNHLEALRRARRISRYAFAREMHVAPTTVWRWEQGKLPIALRDLMEMARVLQVAPTDIVPGLDAVPIITAETEPVAVEGN